MPPPTRITLEAIEAARAAFEQLAQGAAATDEGLSFDDIVIARNVTHEDLEQVPYKWLYGMRAMLRADGVLVITKLCTHQYLTVWGQLTRQLDQYGTATGLCSGSKMSLTLRDGSVVTPDAEVYEYASSTSLLPVPLVLFEVEVHHRPIAYMVETATTYLDHRPSVQRVVFLKFFPPHDEALCDNCLCVPALVLVFGRDVTGRVVPLQMQSFGNAPVDRYGFVGLPDQDVEDLFERYGAASPWLPSHLNTDNLRSELAALRAQEHHHGLFRVDMAEGYRAIPVNLVQVFVEAMFGWGMDRAEAESRKVDH